MTTDIAVKYFRLAEALYYKILEAVIDQEKKRLGDTDLSVSLSSLTVMLIQSVCGKNIRLWVEAFFSIFRGCQMQKV